MRNSIITLTLTCAFALALALPIWAQNNDPVTVLKSDAPFAEKAEACRSLVLQGGPKAVDALQDLLADKELSHMARLALEPMPCPEAGEALRKALRKARGDLRVGIIHSLGSRKDEEAVRPLQKLLARRDSEMAQAAARALGRIGTPKAIWALEHAVDKSSLDSGDRLACCDALCNAAETLAANGEQARAIEIYHRLRQVHETSPEVHAAVLRGEALARGGEQGIPLVLEALRGGDDKLFDAALRTARELDGGDAVTAALAEALAELPAERKIRLIHVLGYRGGQVIGAPVLEEAKDGCTGVRVAALRALTRVGYTPALELMQKLALSEDATLAKAARDALSYFPGDEGDAVIKAMLESDEAKARRTGIELISQGGLGEPVDLLMDRAQNDEDESVRTAALEALRDYAGMDQMPALLEGLLKAASQAEMAAAESALKALSTRQEKAPTGHVTIQKAVYGDLPDGSAADVTKTVAQIVKSGALAIDASNANFDDPAPGIPKTLTVSYTVNGVAATKTAPENQRVVLTTGSVPSTLVEAFASAQKKAEGEAQLALLRLLGATGSNKAFEIVRSAALQGKGDVKETALRELCGWSTLEALPSVMKLATASKDETEKVLALRGAVRLLKQETGDPAAVFKQYVLLMDKANTPDERKLVLSGLAQIHCPDALDMAFAQFADESVKAEAVQTAIAIAQDLGKAAKEDKSLTLSAGLDGWDGKAKYWKAEDGAVTGQSSEPIPKNDFVWAPGEVRDFYLAVDVKLEPNEANAGIQFRSKQINDYGQAKGYQADMGKDVWGRLYYEQGRGKLDWNDRAEPAVKPGEWNRYEILAVGPAIWTAINGTLGVALLDINGERAGKIAFQIHAGDPQKAMYRVVSLVHNPKVELAGKDAKALIGELKLAK